VPCSAHWASLEGGQRKQTEIFAAPTGMDKSEMKSSCICNIRIFLQIQNWLGRAEEIKTLLQDPHEVDEEEFALDSRGKYYSIKI
jgi:hypothetical protein